MVCWCHCWCTSGFGYWTLPLSEIHNIDVTCHPETLIFLLVLWQWHIVLLLIPTWQSQSGCTDLGLSGKDGTHQAIFKELAVMKAGSVVVSCRLCLDQKSGLEHTAQTIADYKLACSFGSCMRGISCLYQKLSIGYIHHSKGETDTRIYQIYPDIRNVNKVALAVWVKITPPRT